MQRAAARSLSPDGAIAQLGGFATGISGAVLLDAAGGLAAWGARRDPLDDDLESGDPAEARGLRLRDLVVELLAGADSGRSARCSELEVSAAGGAVFAVRGRRYTLAAVAPRTALSSLMLYDLRSVLDRLDA